MELDGYRNIVLIDAGGLGDVYTATSVTTGITVVIKALRDVGDQTLSWHRAQRELQALSSLVGHPHVIQIEEILQDGGTPLLVMEHAAGGSIAALLRERGRITVGETVLIGLHVASALSATHEIGVIHRDVKPQNILIGSFGQAKVCDFGIASIAWSEQFRNRTQALSYRYASPEELDAIDDITPATDIYSLGATLVHCLHGQPPSFTDRNAEGRHLQFDHTVPRLVDPDLSRPLEQLLHRCLDRDPTSRPTASELEEQLDLIDQGLGVHRVRALGQAPVAPPPTPPTPPDDRTQISVRAGVADDPPRLFRFDDDRSDSPDEPAPMPPDPGPSALPAAVAESAATTGTAGRAAPGRRRATVLIAALGALVVSAAIGAVGLGWGQGSSGPMVVDTIAVGAGPQSPISAEGAMWVPNSGDGSISVIDPATRTVTDTITVGQNPVFLVAADDRLWVPNSGDGTVSVIDPTTRTVTDTITVGRTPIFVVATDRHLWVPNTGDGTVSVIDLTTRTVTDTVTVGSSPQSPIAADGSIWVPNGGDATVSVIDATTRTVTDTISVGRNPQTAIATAGHIWIPNSGDGTLSVIDPATRTVTDTIALGRNPVFAAAAAGLVWITNTDDGTLSAIDPATRTVVETVAVGRYPQAVIAADDRLWIANSGDATVAVVDPAAGTLTNTIGVGQNPVFLTASEGRVWVSNANHGTVSVID